MDPPHLEHDLLDRGRGRLRARGERDARGIGLQLAMAGQGLAQQGAGLQPEIECDPPVFCQRAARIEVAADVAADVATDVATDAAALYVHADAAQSGPVTHPAAPELASAPRQESAHVRVPNDETFANPASGATNPTSGPTHSPAAPLVAPRVLVKPRIAETPANAGASRADKRAGNWTDNRTGNRIGNRFSGDDGFAPAVASGTAAAMDNIPWASDEIPVFADDEFVPDAAPEWAGFPDEAPSREDLIAAMDWAQLQQAAASCQACELCQGRGKSVFGRGNPKALWLVVGDSPNAQDETAGQPLSGDAGTLLDNMLAASGRVQQAYVTNLVKCRAQDAQGQPRAPTPQEIAACRPFLQRQFSLLQPRLTLALGKTAALAMRAPDAPATTLRGHVHQAFGKPMVATWHPGILLGQPLEKRQAWADLCLARNSDGSDGAHGA